MSLSGFEKYSLTRPAFVPALNPKQRSFSARIRRRLKLLILATVDSGWLGLTPLRTHVVVCGFPRSGSTLLQLIAETCVTGLRAFGEEAPAVTTALWAWRNHSVMLTKDPFDVFRVDEIREFYSSRSTQVRFVLTKRDPRDILVSSHSRRPDSYYLTCAEWQAYYEHFEYARQGGDTTVIEFEQLVQHPADVETQLGAFIGWTIHRPFDRFHQAVRKEFDITNLNGLRPLDPAAIHRWRESKHRERVCRILRELPKLPDILIDMGYESNTEWVRDYI